MKQHAKSILLLLVFIGLLLGGSLFIDVTSETELSPHESGNLFTGTSDSSNENAIVDIQACSVTFSVPDTIYLTVGTPFQLYFNNVLTPSGYILWFGVEEILVTNYYDTYLEVTAPQEGVFELPWRIYDSQYQLVDSGMLHFVATDAEKATDATVLVIGDSLINAGDITRRLLELFEEQGKTLTLLGSRGEGENRHEGRGGWTAGDYLHAEIRGKYTNIFLNNGTFDFSYYMESQGYDHVDYVVLQLGTNDIFSLQIEDYNDVSKSILENFAKIIQCIHDYDSKIQIIVNLTIPPTSNQAVFTEIYGTRQISFVVRNNMIRYGLDLQEHFSAANNVYFAAVNCVLDTETDFSDGIHPTPIGFEKMAQTIFNAIIYLQNE